MPDIVRVREGDREYNTGRAFAEAHKLTILDEPARDRAGALRPVARAGGRKVKPKTSVAEAAAKKAEKSAEQPDNQPSEEN